MPSFWKRNEQPDPEPEPEKTSPVVAALIASVEMTASELHDELSRGEFRQMVRDRNRSEDEAWRPIRAAALAREDWKKR